MSELSMFRVAWLGIQRSEETKRGYVNGFRLGQYVIRETQKSDSARNTRVFPLSETRFRSEIALRGTWDKIFGGLLSRAHLHVHKLLLQGKGACL